MCGRYLMHPPPDLLAELFDLQEIPIVTPRYNIAPTQQVLACRQTDKGREMVALHWGLIPFWANDPKIGYRMINARSDGVAAKPSYRAAFKQRRCLIPATGFYEWQAVKAEKKKQPHLIRRMDEKPFAFAGLWEHWDKGANPIDSCTIITTDCNKTLKPIHDRMPVILDKKDFATWLDLKTKPEALTALLCPAPEKLLEAVPVGLMVNNPKFDNPKCCEPVSAA